MLYILLCVVGLSYASGEIVQQESSVPVNYNGYSVLEASGMTEEKVKEIDQFLEANFDVVQLHRDRITGTLQLAVPPSKSSQVRFALKDALTTIRTVTEDIGDLMAPPAAHIRSEPLFDGQVTFDRYMKFPEIESYLRSLPEKYPDQVRRETIGRTTENREIHMLVITNQLVGGNKKPVVFLDGGIHAREWISPASVLFVVERLLQTPALVNNLEWRVIPMLNPDGYVYSWTNDRLWRKNRRSIPGTDCKGTDLNRNFDFHWMEVGASNKACSEVFAGPSAFSENESRALRDAIQGVSRRVKAYVSVHSYGQMIIYPWGYTNLERHPQAEKMKKLGNKMSTAISRKTGSKFRVNTAGGVLYTAAGGSDDYFAGPVSVPLSFTFELRDTGAYGFLLPDHLIGDSANELWIGLATLGRELLSTYGPAVYRNTEIDTEEQGLEVTKPVEGTKALELAPIPYQFLPSPSYNERKNPISIPISYYPIPHLLVQPYFVKK